MKNTLPFFLGVTPCFYGHLLSPRRQQTQSEEYEPEWLQDLEKVGVCLALRSGWGVGVEGKGRSAE